MDRKFSDPERYGNSIDWDDAPDGSEGGYSRHGNYIQPDVMMELVSLRAENQRLRAILDEEGITLTETPEGTYWVKPIQAGEE